MTVARLIRARAGSDVDHGLRVPQCRVDPRGDHDGHRGWVYYVAVHPDRRGRGHGRAIMRACETWLSTRDVPKIDLMVRTENDAVIAFYAALGYGHDDVVVMSKRLR